MGKIRTENHLYSLHCKQIVCKQAQWQIIMTDRKQTGKLNYFYGLMVCMSWMSWMLGVENKDLVTSHICFASI